MSINLGRLMGIPIRINYTLWLVFLLIAWSLAVGYMPSQYPGLSTLTYWGIGVACAAILFISILIHELSHSLIAKRNNLPIARITLFFFGGVSEMTEEPRDASLEVRMAAAGPLMSFLIAIVLGGGWYVGVLLHLPTAVEATLWYSGLINLVLGIFNLVPAFPLDGGRVFRGTLWRRSGNLLGATQTATRVSEGIAFLLMLGGFLILFIGDLVDGIWFFFLGWFIRSGAETSYRQTLFSESLTGVTVDDIMSRDVRTVPPEITIQQLISDYLLIHSHGSYPVVADHTVLGLVTLDSVRAIPPEKRSVVSVRDAMIFRDRVPIVQPSTPAADLMQRIAKSGLGSALVMEEEHLLGIVTSGDIMRTIKMRQTFGAPLLPRAEPTIAA